MTIESKDKYLEQNPDKLIEELKERAKWYAKGFSDLLVSLKQNAYKYAKGKDPEQAKEIVRRELKEVTDLYKAIPFNELKGHPDFDLLSAINKKIPELKREVHEILNGGKTDMGDLKKITDFIFDKGDDFRDRLTNLLEEIRKYPGYESFTFKSTDINRRLWQQTF